MTPPGLLLPATGSLRHVPIQERGRQKLSRMLAAADRILAEDGADAVTTTRIAAVAGISVGTVYRYLPHREAVIDALAQHYLALLEAEAARLFAELPVAVAHIGELVDPTIDAFADFYRRHAGFRALWFGRHLTAHSLTFDRVHKERIAVLIRTALAERGLGGEDVETLERSRAVQLSIDALIQEAFRQDPEGDRSLLRQAKRLAAAFLAAD